MITFHAKFLLLKLFSTFAPLMNFGAIAQLVEQRTENPCVPGSIPGGTTSKAFRRGPGKPRASLLFIRKAG
jgi:hypothetical protein